MVAARCYSVKPPGCAQHMRRAAQGTAGFSLPITGQSLCYPV